MKIHADIARLANHALAAGLLTAAGVLGGCHAHQTQTTTQAEPASDANQEAEPMPVASDLMLYGEDDSWLAQTLPADPIPFPGNPNSADVSRVTKAEQGADFDPTISADGSFMVFASTQHHNNADIYLKNTGSTVLTQLTSDPARDVMPSISPSRDWIAFASDRLGGWNIYVIPRTGGRPVQITSDAASELHPSWSPDGSLLAYSKLGQTSGRWELWITEVSNTATPHFIGYGLFPEWCPKPGTGPTGGDVLLYQRSTERGDRAFGVWTLEYKNGDVGNPSRLIGSASKAYINPTWSPDGLFVVFAEVADPNQVRAANALNHEDCDLWMLAADGSTMVSLTTGSSSDLMPTWGSNGKIYFVSTRTGQDNIWSLDASEAMLAAGLSPSQPFATVPTDSPEGK